MDISSSTTDTPWITTEPPGGRAGPGMCNAETSIASVILVLCIFFLFCILSEEVRHVKYTVMWSCG